MRLRSKLLCIFTIYILTWHTSEISLLDNLHEGNIIYISPKLTYVPSAPLHIPSDVYFGPLGYNFTGNGTESNPYVIENLNITTESGYGIRITDTTKYFVIRNCLINASTEGIYIRDVADNTTVIENVTIIDCNYGIRLNRINEHVISNCTILNCQTYGIYANWCDYGQILDNGLDSSFFLEDSDRNQIERNTLVDTWFQALNCRYFDAKDNHVSGGLYGFELLDVDYSDVLNNTIIDTSVGVLAIDCSQLFLESNSISEVITGLSIEGYSHLYVTDNYFVNCSNRGIHSSSPNFHSDLRNNTIRNCGNEAIYVEDVDDFLITENTIVNSSHGIRVISVGSFNISFNQIYLASVYGIYIEGELCEVHNNSIYECGDYGIRIQDDYVYDAGSSNIYHNVVVACNWLGYSQGCDYGTGNLWYDIGSLEGNYWMNSTDSGEYIVNRFYGIKDPYPLFLDNDLDLMDDHWEEYFGMNIHVNDSSLDSDSDSLSNLMEFLLVLDPSNPDSDNDLLLDGDEYNLYNTDPKDGDSDNDGLSDGEEVLIYFTDPNSIDSDSDWLDDYDEIFWILTDPTNPDTDFDGIPDGWEYYHGTNATFDDSDLDPDNDTLTNWDEYIRGTHPNNNDTDWDGMSDNYEVDYGLNPLIDDSGEDLDDDGLANLDEYFIGSNPQVNDTDTDGMLDGWEFNFGTNPLVVDDGLDYDNDNLTNLEEFLAGSDPFKIDSDFDGLPDYDEVLVHLTDPSNSDTDSDLLDDFWEIQYGLNPLFDDADQDADNK